MFLKSKFKLGFIFLISISFLLLTSFLIIINISRGNPPPEPEPCKEIISNIDIYTESILNNPVIIELNSELIMKSITISDCIIDEKIDVSIVYEFPIRYSEFGIKYFADFRLGYFRDGSIEAYVDYFKPIEFDSKSIINFYSERIQVSENNPRVREILSKTSFDTLNPDVPVAIGNIPRNNANVTYDFNTNKVIAYSVTNTIIWKEFPELLRAHKIIEENLLVGEISICNINKENINHSYTNATLVSGTDNTWVFTVAISCTEEWYPADVFLGLNEDGSYNKLEINWYPNTEEFVYLTAPALGIPTLAKTAPAPSYPSYP